MTMSPMARERSVMQGKRSPSRLLTPCYRAPVSVPEQDRNVGRYRVLRPLGAGGMSVVYRAYDPSLDRHVALKLIPPWEDTNAFARLQREARAMAQLQHPNVAMVHEVGAHGDRCYIAMELIEGQTAKQEATPLLSCDTIPLVLGMLRC